MPGGKASPRYVPTSNTPLDRGGSGRSGPVAWAALTGSASARRPALRAQAAPPGGSKAKVGDAWLGRAASAPTRPGAGGKGRRQADTADCGGRGSSEWGEDRTAGNLISALGGVGCESKSSALTYQLGVGRSAGWGGGG